MPRSMWSASRFPFIMFRNKEKRNKTSIWEQLCPRSPLSLSEEGSGACVNLPALPPLQVLRTPKAWRSRSERKSWNSRRRRNCCKKNSWRKLRSWRRSVFARPWVALASRGTWVGWPVAWVCYELLTLSCFTGTHGQNAKGVSTERRREAPSGQEASGDRVQVRWQLTAYWGGRSEARSHPVHRQESHLFSFLLLHLLTQVTAADFPPSRGNRVDPTVLFLPGTRWAKLIVFLAILSPVSQRALRGPCV